MVDTQDLKSCCQCGSTGSIPVLGTKIRKKLHNIPHFGNLCDYLLKSTKVEISHIAICDIYVERKLIEWNQIVIGRVMTEERRKKEDDEVLEK